MRLLMDPNRVTYKLEAGGGRKIPELGKTAGKLLL